jgi:hypothetical protein
MIHRYALAVTILVAAFSSAYAQDEYGLVNANALKTAGAVSGLQSRITSIQKLNSEKGVKVMAGSLRMQVHSDDACEVRWVVSSSELPGEVHVALHLKNITSYEGKGRFRNNTVSSKTKPVICETGYNLPDYKKTGGIKRTCHRVLKLNHDHGYPPADTLEEIAMAVEYCNRGEDN